MTSAVVFGCAPHLVPGLGFASKEKGDLMVGGSLPEAPLPPPLPPSPPPTPPHRSFWKRPIGIAVIVVVAFAVISGIGSALQEGGGGSDEDGGGCSETAPGWAEQLSLPPGTYVYADAGAAMNGMPAWVVRKDDGAIWATDVDPSSEPSSGGLLVPLNDQARQDSEAGVDLTDETIAGLFPDASVDVVADCG